MDGDELAEAIASAVNSGIDAEEFREQMDSEHNTLQQYAYDSVLKQGIVALAGSTYVDQRNTRAVEECREIADHMGWEY